MELLRGAVDTHLSHLVSGSVVLETGIGDAVCRCVIRNTGQTIRSHGPCATRAERTQTRYLRSELRTQLETQPNCVSSIRRDLTSPEVPSRLVRFSLQEPLVQIVDVLGILSIPVDVLLRLEKLPPKGPCAIQQLRLSLGISLPQRIGPRRQLGRVGLAIKRTLVEILHELVHGDCLSRWTTAWPTQSLGDTLAQLLDMHRLYQSATRH